MKALHPRMKSVMKDPESFFLVILNVYLQPLENVLS